MKQVAGSLRLDLAQYRDLSSFAQFGSDLDPATRAQLTRGERMTEILKQDKFQACSLENQVMIIFVGTHGFLDEIPLKFIKRYEKEFYAFMEREYYDVPHTLAKTKALDKQTEETLLKAAAQFTDFFKRSIPVSA